MSIKTTLSLVAIACIATSASAMEFQVLGAKAAAMGGAGIATSPSSLAAYNNPALLANNPEKFSLHIGGGFGIKDTGAGKSASDLNKLDFSGVSALVNGSASTASAADIATLTQAKTIIGGMDGKGFGINPTADLGLSFGSFGTGIFGTSDIGAVANVDQNHLDLIYADSTQTGGYYNLLTSSAANIGAYQASSLQYAIEKGLTNLDIVGLAVAEVPLAYGYALNTKYGAVAVGGAAKIMSGKTFFKRTTLDNASSLSNIDQNSRTTTTFGLDLGSTYKPTFAKNLTLAVTGKNLNTPSFAAVGRDNIKIEPAYRAGAAYKIGELVELAFDTDLSQNKSATGFKTQYVGGGASIDLSALELKVGLMKNIAADDLAGPIYTAGIATGPDWLHFELSAQMASKSGEVDGTSYPMQAMVNFAISSAW
jgi:hypothetical protein